MVLWTHFLVLFLRFNMYTVDTRKYVLSKVFLTWKDVVVEIFLNVVASLQQSFLLSDNLYFKPTKCPNFFFFSIVSGRVACIWEGYTSILPILLMNIEHLHFFLFVSPVNQDVFFNVTCHIRWVRFGCFPPLIWMHCTKCNYRPQHQFHQLWKIPTQSFFYP